LNSVVLKVGSNVNFERVDHTYIYITLHPSNERPSFWVLQSFSPGQPDHEPFPQQVQLTRLAHKTMKGWNDPSGDAVLDALFKSQ